MSSLELQVEKPNLNIALDLGVVANVQQIKDGSGRFPETPFEQQLVIPVGAQAASKRTIDVPPGTYRIDARLPSGEVLRETREVGEQAGPVAVIFQSGHASPHEWLGLQRLAGNVPSQDQYELWLKKLARQIGDSSLRKELLPDGAIDFDPAALSTIAGFLRGMHLRLKSSLDFLAGAASTLSDKIIGAAGQPTLRETGGAAAEAQQMPDFRIV